MRQINELDPVIRRVESPTKEASASQVLVVLDRRGRTLPKSRLRLPWFGRRRYLVTNSNDAEAVARCRNLEAYTYFSGSNKPVDVVLSYEARCQPGKETRLAEALWHEDDNLEEHLHSRICSWVLHDLDDEIRALMADKPGARMEACAKLDHCAGEKLGLLMKFELELKHPKRLQRIVVPSFHVLARARDWDEEIDLNVEVDLEIAPGSEYVAYNADSSIDPLRDTIREVTKKFFSLDVSLHEFHTELKDSVKDRLVERLDERMVSYGRRVERLILVGETFRIIDPVNVNVPVECDLKEFPRKVKITSKVLMNLCDVGKYFAKGRPEIVSWLERNVKEVTESTLFNVTYRDLWTDHKAKKRQIRKELRQRAGLIGYEVRQIITITDLELDALRDDFSISLKDEFGTKLAKFSVGIEIQVVAALKNRDDLPELLTQHKSVRDSMKRQLQRRIEQQMHTIDPESFYMDFELARNKSEPVRTTLQRLVTSTLEDKFRCRTISVACKQLDTELSKLHDRLASERKKFSVEVDFMLGQPSVAFNGRFRVLGVDHKGWHDFRRAAPFDLSDVAESVAGHAREVLIEEGFSTSFKSTPSSLKRILRDWVCKPIKHEFGLQIEITHFGKNGHGSDALSEHSKKLWERVVDTQEKSQLSYEDALRDTRQAHADSLQSGNDEKARELAQRIGRLDRERQRTLKQSTGYKLPGAGEAEDPPFDESAEETPQSEGNPT